MKFKYIIKELKKNIIFTLILVIQLTVMFSILYSLFQVQSVTKAEVQKVNNYFKDKQVFTIRRVSSEDRMVSKTKASENELESIAENLIDSKDFIYTSQASYIIMMPVISEWNKFARWSELSESDENTYYAANHLVINKNNLKQFNIKIASGRGFNDEEYSLKYDQKIIPVILGYDYSEFYKVGDIIKSFPDGKSLEVIGILEKNQYMPCDMMEIERYANLDDYVLTNTYCYDDYSTMYNGLIQPNFIFYDNNKSDSEIAESNNNIKKLFKDKIRINVIIEPQEKIINQELNASEDQLKVLNAASIILIIFLSITSIITKLSFIDKRKKEFGVHILSGGTLKDIASMIYLETFVSIIVALYIFNIISAYRYGHVDYLIVFYIIIIALLISVVLTIVPIIKIMRFNTATLVKGEE
ncbi:ABC transporter permease [Clostridium beijerinckii]|uniref:ABC transporter permease n=1 Tax=Clostridium beijerinckii TaxID=1520 RepID=UPI00157093E0|nr:ABC transporter permease [Clostridium beijerinckii]NRT71380.1 putative ABC transport system permease protein [Clostridium beijerinckii]